MDENREGEGGKISFAKAIEPMPKTPALVIDSSAIRNHLFKGWVVLNRVAVIARTGKINLCIPWIIEQEVLSGIEEHVDELTEQEAFLKSARIIAVLSSEAGAIRALCDKFEELRPKICEEARNRFRHWLTSSQADRLPLNSTIRTSPSLPLG